MNRKTVSRIMRVIASFGVFVAVFCSGPTVALEKEASNADAERTGAWVDTVQISTIPSASDALDQLEAGSLDIYTSPSLDPTLYGRALLSPEVVVHTSMGNYDELMLNPAGPIFNDGRLNPFAVPAIREAMNWLVDRTYIVQQIRGGAGGAQIPLYSAYLPRLCAVSRNGAGT